MYLFIRAPDLGFLKPLCSKAKFFVFDPARKIRDNNKTLVHFTYANTAIIWEHLRYAIS
jgi:hypothetical protein